MPDQARPQQRGSQVRPRPTRPHVQHADSTGGDAGPATTAVSIRTGDAELDGVVRRPENPRGVVLFAHGTGSSRHSPRNRTVARALHQAGFATVLVDLLTAAEEQEDHRTGQVRFDVELLGRRVTEAVGWLAGQPENAALPIGLFGASTGAAGALAAAAERVGQVRAVVSRGGRPDLASRWLASVRAPTLLIVGALDHPVLALNRQAADALGGPSKVHVVAGATHLFEEAGALSEVAAQAAEWFGRHLGAGRPPS